MNRILSARLLESVAHVQPKGLDSYLRNFPVMALVIFRALRASLPIHLPLELSFCRGQRFSETLVPPLL